MFFPIPLEFKYVGAKSSFPVANAALILVNVLVYLFACDWPVGPGTGPASILAYAVRCSLGLACPFPTFSACEDFFVSFFISGREVAHNFDGGVK
jgi:hypothetical protein